MSHITVIKTTIKNPNVELLMQTVGEYAKSIGGTVTSSIEDYYGHTTNVLVGFKTASMRRGVGISLNDAGEVEVSGDFWNVQGLTQQEVTQQICQRYVANATQVALRNTGYTVNRVTDTAAQTIILRAYG